MAFGIPHKFDYRYDGDIYSYSYYLYNETPNNFYNNFIGTYCEDKINKFYFYCLLPENIIKKVDSIKFIISCITSSEYLKYFNSFLKSINFERYHSKEIKYSRYGSTYSHTYTYQSFPVKLSDIELSHDDVKTILQGYIDKIDKKIMKIENTGSKKSQKKKFNWK